MEYFLTSENIRALDMTGKSHEQGRHELVKMVARWSMPAVSSKVSSKYLFFKHFLWDGIIFFFLYSRFLLVINFIHISVYMSIPIAQFEMQRSILNWILDHEKDIGGKTGDVWIESVG